MKVPPFTDSGKPNFAKSQVAEKKTALLTRLPLKILFNNMRLGYETLAHTTFLCSVFSTKSKLSLIIATQGVHFNTQVATNTKLNLYLLFPKQGLSCQQTGVVTTNCPFQIFLNTLIIKCL